MEKYINKIIEVAEIAYEIYCQGDGKTEYECIEEAFEKYEKEIEEHE